MSAEEPTSTDGRRSAEQWAELLAAGWERRARDPARDFYVASNPGWRDPETWARYARQDLELFLVELDRAELARSDVLEIGCGSGRLVPFLRPSIRSYSGFDIAPGMIDAARERTAALADVRFAVGDGLAVPPEFADRRYALVFAVAVFIHCPRDVIERNVRSAWPLVAPGGCLRFQVLADPSDATGLAPSDGSAELQREVESFVAESTHEQRALADEPHYMGHRFRYDEVLALMEAAAAGGTVTLYRGDLAAIYGSIVKVSESTDEA